LTPKSAFGVFGWIKESNHLKPRQSMLPWIYLIVALGI
jgi:hypothetical protein